MKGLYAIVDYELLGERIDEITQQIIAAGVKIIQFRAKNLTDQEFVTHALKLRHIAQEITFIINDRPDIALAVGADGVHLGQDDMPIPLAHKLLKDKIIGISTHNLDQAIQAGKEEEARLVIDYLAIGPIYQTSTKKNALPPLGTAIISQIKNLVGQPVVAVGGINEENIEEVIQAGADAVAIASGLLKGENVTSTILRLIKKYDEIRH